jgi:hypothetical protein
VGILVTAVAVGWTCGCTRRRRRRCWTVLGSRWISGLEGDPRAVALFEKGRCQAVLDRYEKTNPDIHLLCVQAAFLQGDPGAEPAV